MLEYLSQFSQPIAKTLQTIFLSLAVLTGANPSPVIINTPVQEVDLAPIEQKVNLLGANISALADFRSSLSSEISSSATSMTLESFTSGSDSLIVGKTYGFKLGGREYVLGEASTANTVINMTRGISRGTGTTTVAAYQSRWGRGTAVEITDAPVLIRAANILGGTQTIENTLKYDSTVATTTIDDDNRNLVNYELLTYTAFNGAGVVDASITQRGVVELATQIETASSTGNGSVGVLAIPASLATSTYNSATAPLRVVVTGNDGRIDSRFIGTSTLFSNVTLSGTTTVSSIVGGTGSGNGLDGDVTISSPTTLSRDMYYNNLVVNDVLTTAGYRIFVKGTISGTGTVRNRGNAGGGGSNMTGGTAGAAAHSAAYFPAPVAGANGANGNTSGNNGDTGTAGTAVSSAIGSTGVAGGTGGPTGGTAGAAGAKTAVLNTVGVISWQTISGLDLSAAGTPVKWNSSSGSGSGGAGDSLGSADSGGGGGSGSPGGIVFIHANVWTGTFTIDVSGGAGGQGGSSAGGAAAGGGGGGGSGGAAVVVYSTKTWTGSYNLAGGAAGAAGVGGGGGPNGSAGAAGNTGVSYEILNSLLTR